MIANKVDSVYGVVKQADPKYYYTGESTDTATVSIDNKDKLIKVDVKTEGILGHSADKAYPGEEGYENRLLINSLRDNLKLTQANVSLFQGNLKGFQENLDDLENDLDKISSNLHNLETDLDNSSKSLSSRISTNVSDIKKLSEEIDTLKSTLGDVSEEIIVKINNDIKSVSDRVDTLEENLQGTTDEIIQAMQLEITEISNSVEDLKNSIDGAISDGISAVSDRVTILESIIGDKTKGLIFDVASVKSSVDRILDTHIPEINEDIENITKQVSGETGLQSQVASLNLAFSTFQNSVTKDLKLLNEDVNLLSENLESLTAIVEGDNGLTSTVANNSKEILDIKDYIDTVLDPLKFTSIPSLSETSVVEFGTEVNRNITWAVNKKPDKLYIGGEEVLFEGEQKNSNITYDSTNNSFTYMWKNVNSNSNSLTIKVDYKNQSVQQAVRVTFTYYIYYGKGTLDADFPEHLDNMTSRLSTTSAISSATVRDIGESEYFYYACPKTYNKPTFSVGGWVGGVEQVKEKSCTKKYGDTLVSYDVYRSNNDNLQTTTFNIT